MEARGKHPDSVSFVTIPHLIPLKLSLSLNLELSVLVRLASKQASRIHLSPLPQGVTDI